MTKSRLKVDFSNFYEDERRLAYVLVNFEWDHVVELEEHVQRLFDIPKVHFITDEGIFIPSRESIEVVKGCELLKAFTPKKFKKKKATRHESIDEADDEVVAGDKRKHSEHVSISSSTPNGPVKKKRKPNFESAPFLADASPKVAVTSTNSGDKSSSDLSKSADLVEDTVKSRKRKRVRKRARPSEEEIEKSTRLSFVPVPISSSTLRLSKSMSTPQPKHVRFDEDATLVQDDGETGGRCVVFRCCLGQDGSLQAREIEAEKKPKIVIHENILLVEGRTSSDDGNNTSVIEIEDSMLKAPNGQMETVDPDLSTIDQILPVSAILDDLSVTSDIVPLKGNPSPLALDDPPIVLVADETPLRQI